MEYLLVLLSLLVVSLEMMAQDKKEAIAQIVITLQFSFWALFLHLYEPISL